MDINNHYVKRHKPVILSNKTPFMLLKDAAKQADSIGAVIFLSDRKQKILFLYYTSKEIEREREAS